MTLDLAFIFTCYTIIIFKAGRYWVRYSQHTNCFLPINAGYTPFTINIPVLTTLDLVHISSYTTCYRPCYHSGYVIMAGRYWVRYSQHTDCLLPINAGYTPFTINIPVLTTLDLAHITSYTIIIPKAGRYWVRYSQHTDCLLPINAGYTPFTINIPVLTTLDLAHICLT